MSQAFSFTPPPPERDWSSVVGAAGDDPAFWESEKKRLLDKIGDIEAVRVTLNRVLVAVWVRPGEKELSGGAKIVFVRQTVDEDKWQGVVGLVLAVGPQAFEDDTAAGVHFYDADKCRAGDWVIFRKGDGFRIPMRGQQCVMLESEKGIKAVLSRPDLVVES